MTEIANSSFFICPISNRPLRYLSENEIAVVNQKISSGQLYFYKGIQVENEIQSGLITENQTYMYPIVEEVVLLKKDTAITAKNRTKNPLLRVTEDLVEEFFQDFNLLRKNHPVTSSFHKDLHSQPLSNDQLMQLKALLPKEGECFMSAVTHDVDALHNLVFNAHFDHYLHIDFSIDRLLAIRKEVKEGTVLVLCENANLPFAEDTVDALFSFDYINAYEKDDQKVAYEELKRVLKSNGASVVLYDKNKPLYAQSHLKSDQFAKKTLGYIAPWKKRKLPAIHFHAVERNDSDGGGELLSPSLGGQFS